MPNIANTMQTEGRSYTGVQEQEAGSQTVGTPLSIKPRVIENAGKLRVTVFHAGGCPYYDIYAVN